MSLYYCSITGEPAEKPIVSNKSGHVFEKRVIEKYIDANPVCPITGQPLTRDDLVAVQVNNLTKPRPVNGTSVSDLVTIFQSEWDGLMLEAHGLKKNVENIRQELSHTLYQHDAACRVIARLVRERDEAKAQLQEFYQNNAAGEGIDEEGGLPKEIVDQITEKKAELSKMRKDRKKNKELIGSYASQEMISAYSVTNSLTLHSTVKPGITCLDINPDQDNILVTGGNSGAVIFFDKAHNKILSSFEKHHKKITDVKFVSNRGSNTQNTLCIVSSEDGLGHLLSQNNETRDISVSYKINTHRSPLVACTVHPLSYLGLFGSKDGTISYHDLSQGRFLTQVGSGNQLRTMRVHPDGHIAALAGADGVIRIWNILENTQIAEVKAHNSAIDSLSFSENGVNFATGSLGDRTVKLWDLRNLSEENFKIVDENAGGCVNFDQFGQFLAVGTTSLRLFNVKDLEEFVNLDSHKETITSVQFGSYSKYIATVSLDRHLNIYS